jgi:pyruvate/2-oxoglutarate dehydrogenase complex dihydrolipoamide dehydrogenase (E3) component
MLWLLALDHPAGNIRYIPQKNGFSVALIESELVGGDCAYWSCVPSKALLRPPEALTEARQVDGAKQAAVGNLGVESVLRRRDFYVDNWDDHNLTKMMEEGGVHIIRGHGRLDGRKRVLVTSTDGVTTTLVARHAVVLSTGSTSTIPDVAGLVQARPCSSRNATSAKKVPQRLAIIGDGAVACEMADIWSSLGAKVTILSRHEKILERFEPFVGDQLAAAFTKRGITIHTKVNVVQVKRSNPNEPVNIELDNGTMIQADQLLVAVGRTPKTGDIGLETVGLKPQQWLDVDDTCLVQGLGENDWLYAIGDINHRDLLTHMGKYQGRASAKSILARARGTVIDDHSEWSLSVARADHDMTPQVLFTDPQAASVGLTEKDVKRLGLNTYSVDSEMGIVVGAQLHTDGYVGHARLVIDEDKHIIVGATFVGPQVSELLYSATIAVVGQVPIDRLWHAVPCFPTVSEVWLQLLENYSGKDRSSSSVA